MQEMNKVQRALDKVMDLQHRIVNSIASMAERECNREPIREIEEGVLLKEFEISTVLALGEIDTFIKILKENEIFE